MRQISFYITLIFSLLTNIFLFASDDVTNVISYQKENKIIIEYNLSEKSMVYAYYSIDGASFHIIEKATGDVGAVNSKGHKRIEWNVLEEFDKFCYENVRFKIVNIAFQNNSNTKTNTYAKDVSKTYYKKYHPPFSSILNSYNNEHGRIVISLLSAGGGLGVTIPSTTSQYFAAEQSKTFFSLPFEGATFRVSMVETALAAFRVDFVEQTKIYYEPQLRLILPFKQDWACTLSIGPTLEFSELKFYFTVGAGIRMNKYQDIFIGDFFIRYNGNVNIGISISVASAVGYGIY